MLKEMFEAPDTFKFKPADFYPFKDQAEIDRVRKITYEDIIALDGKAHPNNPNMTIHITDQYTPSLFIADCIMEKLRFLS